MIVHRILDVRIVNPKVSMLKPTKRHKMSFKELENKIITHAFIENGKELLGFNTNEGMFIYCSEGDCCNEVWFEHLSGIEAIGGKVLSVEAKGWNSIDDCDSNEDVFLDAGFWSIKTTKGYIDIEVRNSHNGYYGGNVRLITGVKKKGHTFKFVRDDF